MCQTKLEERKRKMLAQLRAMQPAPKSPIDFYKSHAWKKISYKAKKKANGRCQLCNRKGVEIHADHIKPRSKYPELAMDENNIQVLCRDCNIGKGNWDETDWRK